MLLCFALFGAVPRAARASATDPHPYVLPFLDGGNFWWPYDQFYAGGTTLSLRIYYGPEGSPNSQLFYNDATGADVFVEYTGTPTVLATLFHTKVADNDVWIRDSQASLIQYPISLYPYVQFVNSGHWLSPHWFDLDDFPGDTRWLCPVTWAPDYWHSEGLRTDVVATAYTNYTLDAAMTEDQIQVVVSSPWAGASSPGLLDAAVGSPLAVSTLVHAVGIDIHSAGVASPNPGFVQTGKTIGLEAVVLGDLPESHRRGPPSWTCSDALRFVAADGTVIGTATTGYTPLLKAIAPSSAMNDLRVGVSLNADRIDAKSPVLFLSKTWTLTALQVNLEFQNVAMATAGVTKVVDPFAPPVSVRIGVITGDTIGLLAAVTPIAIVTGNGDYVWTGSAAGTGPTISVPTMHDGLFVDQLTVLACVTRVAHITALSVPYPTETTWAIENPLDALTANSLADEASVWAAANQVALGGGIHNGRADAARHIYWSLLMSLAIGAGQAEGAATAHERSGLDAANPHNETVMDMENNAIGRSLSSAYTSATPRATLQAAVLTTLNSGNPTILDDLTNALEVGLLIPSN